MTRLLSNLPLVLALSTLTACGPAAELDDDLPGDDAQQEEPADFGIDAARKGFDEAGEYVPGKEDGISGDRAVRTDAPTANTKVWKVWNFWEERNTAEAKQAGLAWPANSGLDWNEKYALWVKSLPAVQGVDGWRTFVVTSPYGVSLPAPKLECSEAAFLLRVLFASWYNLPFFIEAKSGSTRMFLGHFGWRTPAGKYANSPDFAALYKDHTLADRTKKPATWPTDARLAGRGLTPSDDSQTMISATARTGAWLDRMLLNKRVGYMLLILMDWYGSMNIADAANTFNIKPEATRTGDVLIERWQPTGVGHTLIVKTAEWNAAKTQLTSELASSSMPRRQPKWTDALASRYYFTADITGGEGTDWQGNSYAAMGGGMKRWRSAKPVGSYWINAIPASDTAVWINSTNLAAISARPARYDALLSRPDPATERQEQLKLIEDLRAQLRRDPAGCNGRALREEAFARVIEINHEHFGISRRETEHTYRKWEDYLFAPLVYTASKTCCWDTVTPAMGEIVMARAKEIAESSGQCRQPPIFKAVNGGYADWKAWAVAHGRGAEWKEWSEDEACPQRNVQNDTEGPFDAQAWCSL